MNNEMIKKYTDIARGIATNLLRKRSFYKSCDLLEDLVQEGLIEAIKSLEKFDPNKGTPQDEWVIYHIKWAITSACWRDNPFKVPESKKEQIRKLIKSSKDLLDRYEREPTDNELAQEMKISENEIKNLRTLIESPTQLDNSIGQGKDIRQPPKEIKEIEEQPLREGLRSILKKLCLSPIEEGICQLYYIEGKSCRTIATELTKIFGKRHSFREVEKIINRIKNKLINSTIELKMEGLHDYLRSD